MAGTKNKSADVWTYLKEFDIIGLVETWVDAKEWNKIEKWMPKEYIWKCEPATREKNKGRSMGGIITGVRKELEEKDEVICNKNVVERRVTINKEIWRIFTVYSKGKEDTKRLSELIEDTCEENLLVGGDFNGRTGVEGGVIEEESKSIYVRKSKDKLINDKGKILLKEINKKGWMILNGCEEVQETGEWTYIGEQGKSVIDYVIVNSEARFKIKSLEVGDRIESDHLPLIVQMKGGRTAERERDEEREIKVSDWSEEGIEHFQNNMSNWINEKTELNDIWRGMKEQINKAKKVIQRKRYNWQLGQRKWHNKEWKERKRNVRRKLREFKDGITSREQYLKERKTYKEWCIAKKIEQQKEEEDKIKNIKTETEVWKYINKKRKRREGIEEGILLIEWENHFMNSLEGTKTKVVLNLKDEDDEEGELEDDDDIQDIEFENQIKKLKKRKAVGEDGVENEVWMYATQEMVNVYKQLVRKIWKEGGILEDWKVGIISPVYKKGNRKEVSNYRGITIMNTAYKIYAGILNDRLVKAIEQRQNSNDTQYGFKKERGTIDCIYILNYLINKAVNKKKKKKGKLCVFFGDLKSAFDKVNRNKLRDRLKEVKIGRKLRNRILETYEETKNIVRINKELTKEFWTSVGLRQGCPMSPSLFNEYIGDLEAYMREGVMGGVVIGNMKIWTISYADDIILLANSETELAYMIKRFKKYLKEKELTLSPDKSKVIIFKKGRGQKDTWSWKWGDTKIEEVKEIKYLGYIVQKNGKNDKHVKEVLRKMEICMRSTWSIGEQLFKDSFWRRVKLYQALVESLGLYGAEIWGWEKKVELDKVQRKYLKWVLSLQKTTADYLVLEETKQIPTSIKAIKRAVAYEEKAKLSNKNLIKECIREIEKDKQKEDVGEWEAYREDCWDKVNFNKEERDRIRGQEESVAVELYNRWIKRENECRMIKLENSKSCSRYKDIRTENIPIYLTKDMRGKDKCIIARFRVGNEEKANKYWIDESEKECKVCRNGKDTLEHIVNDCKYSLGEQWNIEDLLNEDARGLKTLKRILEIKKSSVCKEHVSEECI